ncbi:G-rich sequence factor 1 [Parasteatoda tepidariorum]|nr:G-rich sequence factor 1 [Parasteatoda tepidariorum]XP_015929485.1 G-rich sequence factor 1 [Parasteatoda tepidariorum]XP_042905677.1 G-rich sequence factor 1 [Parasteatoda tepidariorum]
MVFRNIVRSWILYPNSIHVSLLQSKICGYPSIFMRYCNSRAHVVQMRGLDYETKEGDVIDFFKPLGIKPKAVYLKSDASGRTSAVSEVEFSSHAEAVVAMRKKNAFMGNRFIRLTLKSIDASQESKKIVDSRTVEKTQNEGTFNVSEHLERSPLPSGHTVKMKNAPPRMSDQAIHDLFSPIGLAPISVKPMYDESGIRTGEFHIQFLTKEDAFRAMLKNNTYVGKKFVELSLGQS